jgi:hypothetical protein
VPTGVGLTAAALDAETAANRLGGELLSGGEILCPGPHHSDQDRSLSVKFDDAAPNGFLVHSFAGDDPIACRDHVRSKLGLPPFEPSELEEGHQDAEPAISLARSPGSAEAPSGVAPHFINSVPVDTGNTTVFVQGTAAGPTQEFMERVVAWPGPGEPGYVNLHWFSPKINSRRGKRYFNGDAYKDVQSFMAGVQNCLANPAYHQDIYYCLSTQSDTKTLPGDRVIAARAVPNAIWFKSIWLDIDVEPNKEKKYHTKEEALEAFDAFRIAANLPAPSAMVFSGGGIHVYWISDRRLAVHEWRPYAEGLKALAIKHTLKCDAGITTDGIGVLRVPGTFNWKKDQPRPVTLEHLGSDYDFATDLAQVAIHPDQTPVTAAVTFEGSNPPAKAFGVLDAGNNLSAGMKDDRPLDPGAAGTLTFTVGWSPPPPEERFFVDPYAEFAAPAFPLDVLPPTLANFVEAEHRAMGADPSALAMAALAAVAGAIHAETRARAGDGWYEPPILWVGLIGPPSAMKSPILQKATAPLRAIDHQRDQTWRLNYASWKQPKAAGGQPSPFPPKPGRLVIQDVTPEKVAEILSRDPAGSLLLHDELAGWLGSFERYSSGQASRAFYLSCWNGGPYLKDRVGGGARDEYAEIRVDNLALGVLGGIQPDRLAAQRDLTIDGLLQRFVPVLMRLPERGDENHPVLAAENEYAKLIGIAHSAPPRRYEFAPDATQVRKRVLDRLFRLEQVEGFSDALIGAIGKLKGYYIRFALTLHVAAENAAMMQGQPARPGAVIPRGSAEAAETLLFEFLLPHIFGLYDVIGNGGKDRDTIRSIASFILASDKDRLRPSDITAGVRKFRGQPTNKIAEWASRFCAMGWLQPENDTVAIPAAWLVAPGLRDHFAERRKQAQEARAQAHAILSVGGTRR